MNSQLQLYTRGCRVGSMVMAIKLEIFHKYILFIMIYMRICSPVSILLPRPSEAPYHDIVSDCPDVPR